MEEKLRQTAIQRYVQGEKPKSIYTSLKRTKPWFFKWLRRYKTGEKEWYKNQSKVPQNSPRKITKTDEQRIIETILKMQNAGRIKLSEKQPLASPKLVSYLKTKHALWYWLIIGLAISTSAIVFTIPEGSYPWIYIRNGLGTILVFWLPGYAFTKALFPPKPSDKASDKSLETIVQIALSVGISLALVPMVGLLLYYTPWGIQLTTTVPSLLVLTMIFATAGIKREHQSQLR